MIDTSNFLKLLELVKQNPQMPVFPIVSETICDAKDFSEDVSLCHFEEPYITKFCEYVLYNKLQFITENKKDLITEDVIKNNQGRLPKWEKGIFIPIKPVKKYSATSKNVSNVGGYVNNFHYPCERLRYSGCQFNSCECGQRNLPYSMTIGINEGYSE